MIAFDYVWLLLSLVVSYCLINSHLANSLPIDLATRSFRLHTIAQIHANDVTALPTNVGEAEEPCDTEQTTLDAIVLSPEDSSWQTALTDSAHPGVIFLLHGGLYQMTDKLWLKAGMPTAPIVIKPYNCEAVTLQGSLRPNSYNIIAGIKIEALGINDTKWAIRFDGKNEGAIANSILRNNTILGGTIDAIRLSDDVHNILIQGNHIDGGESGHDIFVTAETIGLLPSALTVRQNHLTKAYFDGASEDMIQVRNTGAITITGNICTDGLNMEQCIEHNTFRYCKGTAIRFASGSRDEQSSALLRYNLFLQSTITDGTILVEEATNLHFVSNSVIPGELKLGNSSQTRLPQKTFFQNNIFYQTSIDDNLLPSTSAYHCAYNLFYQLAGDGFSTSPCTHTIEEDPQFLDFAKLYFHLQTGSPAIDGGESGDDMGAFSMKFAPDGLTYFVYLPLVFP